MAAQFDAMGALSTARNNAPATASRPYDAQRDGFVIAGGGGMLVLEDYEHARRRGANIHAELLGYGVTSDGAGMVAPGGDGAVRSMRMALATVGGPVDYLNAHGTATPIGDIAELDAVHEVFGSAVPPLSSTKSLTGHSLGAAGVQEAIYSLLMLKQGFIAGSANIDELDPRAAAFPIVRASRPARLATVMSNSFGFGGTNATLVFARV
jgi:3-oxoacyl-[acyl-carrier-protein] synthase-1